MFFLLLKSIPVKTLEEVVLIDLEVKRHLCKVPYQKKQKRELSLEKGNLHLTQIHQKQIKIDLELKILSEKINSFLFHLNSKGEQTCSQFFSYGTYELQFSFNKRLELLIGMLLAISKLILSEFKDNPEQIGIQNMKHLVQKEDNVNNETQAFIENFNTLKEVFEYFKNCVSAFKIINQNYERQAEEIDKARLIIDLLDKVRFFSGELFERFKVIERNFQAAKARKRYIDKAKLEIMKPLITQSKLPLTEEHSQILAQQEDDVESTKELLNQLKICLNSEVTQHGVTNTQVLSMLKLKENEKIKVKKRKTGVKKETHILIDKILKRNTCKTNLQKIILNKKETIVSNRDLVTDEYEQLVQQSKEKNMDLIRSERISKALKVGTSFCSLEIAENIFPLQRELGHHKSQLTEGIKEITRQKIAKLRLY